LLTFKLQSRNDSAGGGRSGVEANPGFTHLPAVKGQEAQMRPNSGTCLLLAIVLSLAAAGRAAHLDLQVAIQPALSTVNKDQDLSVATAIRNISMKDQSLQIWSCSYPKHWISDNASVQVKNVGCKKNFLSHITLKPGEAYERILSTHIKIADERDQKSVTFRLGFKPATATTDGKVPTIWSNAATIKIVE